MSEKQQKHRISSIFSFSLELFFLVAVIAPPANAIEFPTAPERNPPQSTAAGGRRGGCVSGKHPIKAFTPGDDNYIKTVSSQPQLFIYIPKTKAKFLQFVIEEENGENINIQEIPITKGDYILQINLPKTVQLETSKKYQWEVSLVCNPLFINSGNYVKGIIERVTLTSEAETKLSENKNVIEQAQIYANQNIWSETLSLVSTVKESQPKQWERLLTSVGLQDYLEKDFPKSSEMTDN